MPNEHAADPAVAMPKGEWGYSFRFLMALQAAATMHAAQRRKGSDVPYVSHLLGTCAIAMEFGADEDEAIAALLHDAIEDVQPTESARAVVASFGERVLAIVEGNSDTDTHPKPPWRERKEAYIAHLATADRSTLLVSAADKLHNARTLVADLRREGGSLWSRFNASRDETLWYYRSVVEAMRGNPAHPRHLLGELGRVVQELEQAVRPDEARITEPAILIRISRLYDPAMSDAELYDATRGHWRIGRRREGARFAFAVAGGIVREVYKIDSWHPAGTTHYETSIHGYASPDRWEFVGHPADAPIRGRYVGASVKDYFPLGSQTPIRYVNC